MLNVVHEEDVGTLDTADGRAAVMMPQTKR
jgi:hypothetical protein